MTNRATHLVQVDMTKSLLGDGDGPETADHQEQAEGGDADTDRLARCRGQEDAGDRDEEDEGPGALGEDESRPADQKRRPEEGAAHGASAVVGQACRGTSYVGGVGIVHTGQRGLDPEEQALPHVLKSRGRASRYDGLRQERRPRAQARNWSRRPGVAEAARPVAEASSRSSTRTR